MTKINTSAFEYALQGKLQSEVQHKIYDSLGKITRKTILLTGHITLGKVLFPLFYQD